MGKILKNLSILQKFLFINLVVFIVLGIFTFFYLGTIQKDLISDRDYEKLQNILESQFVSRNASIEGIANSLSDYHTFYGDANLINTEIEIYQSVTKEEIREVARKYLMPNQRVVLDYLPGDENNKTIIE